MNDQPIARRHALADLRVARDESHIALGEQALEPPRAINHSQRADAGRRQTAGGGEAAGGGDPDPQPGERAWAEPDRDQVDLLPAAGGRGGGLDLAQQRGRVPGPPRRGEPQLRLVQGLAVAPGAGGGVDRRGVEADDDQFGSAPLPNS